MSTKFKMDAPCPRLLDQMAQGVIHLPLDRVEGPVKVTGRATYAAERALPDQAEGVLVRATIAQGRVIGMNNDAVHALPGVLGVFADERFLRNPAQGGAGKAPVQGVTDVFYHGQPVALVVAENLEQARHAAASFRLHYDEVAAQVDPDAATTIERPDAHKLEQGDFDHAMAQAHATVDQIYTTAPHHAAAMELHASVAEWTDGCLTLHGAFQMLKYNRAELADALGIAPEQVRILSPYVGGGVGSKLGISPEAVAAAIAARALGRPVRVMMTRKQAFTMTTHRTATRQRLRLAADAQGHLSAIGHEDRVYNLPGESFSEPTAQSTHFLYSGANRRMAQQLVRVNRPCAGSVRAPGEAVGMLALEAAMDELAQTLGIDPVELRKRNIPERHPETGIPFSARRFAACMDKGARLFGWGTRNPATGKRSEGEWLIGLGMAAAARVNMVSASRARVTLRSDGIALVETDMTDIGTGTYTILGQIAAEMLGLPLAQVEVRLGDTDLPPSAGSGGSHGASSAGSSVFLACETLRARLAERLGCAPEDLTLKDGVAIGANHRVPLKEMLPDGLMSEEGHFEPGATSKQTSQASYGAFFAEVGVNRITGEARVRRMLGTFAAGRILNEKTARSQCQGGMIWGIGAALTEEMMFDPCDGHPVNNDLAEYHLPVNRDCPQIKVHLLEDRDDMACPIQSKGIGELGISGAGAAVLNAIHNATGIRIRSYPATLDKILPHLPD
ncbi:xanthine dehydrogenase family protein molybdopterin-binding subunit [Roseinatronobacter sp. S2]|uniref:xanthine dehydrogenase family protein molybdopterin-binding subunit n=1 Tax=Roseinatronobacter sp. S2 TaxID=3035471 RepID=UPI002410A462|nr:xanthine dehydrogenase family protein molybdopterin-binding subunit [Roseinatronobacter sp. S2]WFE76593.1 xanthine dehydrogenase family protein molybdopterin-binding subunit [Roseinatronobacter sp. S2]